MDRFSKTNISCGKLDNGRPFQKSRLFRPSRVNLPESKVRKELDAFVKVLEEECRIEFATKRQPQTNFELSEGETKHESVEEQVNGDKVTAMVIEYKTGKRNSIFFVYGEMLVEVRCDPAVWDAKWFSCLSFESIAG